jgi:transposase
MSKALSVDLRERVVKAIKAGMSRRQAAARFGVSPASAVRWFTLVQETGDVRPGPLGGDRRSGRIERYAALILELYEKTPDVTLAELKAELAERGVATGMTTIWRFFQRRKITLKKRPRTRRSRTAQIS